MSTQLVDFSFVYEMADDDATYVYEVINLFLKTLSDGMGKLEKLVNEGADFSEIRFQAHFLKSSAKVVKVQGMFDGFFELENMAREERDRDKMLPLVSMLMNAFTQARPELEREIAKNKKAMSKA
ncbi:MAG: hypothetical protein K0Q79_3701 [Flavipsychrobacter sp.]|jgi:hypothetical protein|nr:hypothetical protein [Flavipsychrobacter sp.]